MFKKNLKNLLPVPVMVLLAIVAGCGTAGTSPSQDVDILAEVLSDGTTLTQIGNPHDKPAPQKPGNDPEPEGDGPVADTGGSYSPAPPAPVVPDGPTTDDGGDLYPLLPDKPAVEGDVKDKLLICIAANPESTGKLDAEDAPCPFYRLTIDIVDTGSARLLLYRDEELTDFCHRSFAGFSFDDDGVMSIEFDRATVTIEPVESCEEIEIVVEAIPEEPEETAHKSTVAPPLPEMLRPEVLQEEKKTIDLPEKTIQKQPRPTLKPLKTPEPLEKKLLQKSK